MRKLEYLALILYTQKKLNHLNTSCFQMDASYGVPFEQ